MPVKPIVTPFNPQGGKPPIKPPLATGSESVSPLASALAKPSQVKIGSTGLTGNPIAGGLPGGKPLAQTMDMSPTGQGSQYDLAPNDTGLISPPSKMGYPTKAATGGDTMSQSPIGGGLTSTPIAGGLPGGSQIPQSNTPGGLSGDINNTRYNNPYGSGNGDNSGRNGGNGGSIGGSGGQSQYGSTPNGGSGGNQNNFGNFDQFRDSALEQAMRTLNPQMDSNNAAFEQMMVSRGIQPGTKQYDAQRANLDMRNNDMLGQATYGAQQQGLAAQNQAWNQDYQYDALKNALNQTNVSAAASRYGADQSSAASRYGSDNNLRQAEMANSLGYDRLNQQGREFDINDIYRNQQMDLQGAMGFGDLDLRQQGMDLNAWQAQQGADTNWWNQISGMMNNAPGVNFQPTGDFVGNTVQAGQNQQNNTNQSNAALAGLLGGAFGMSDERLKENIMYVDTIDGVNVYDFDYIDKSLGTERYRGVMAQEVIDTHPDSVSMVNGSYMVDYSQLPVNMEVI